MGKSKGDVLIAVERHLELLRAEQQLREAVGALEEIAILAGARGGRTDEERVQALAEIHRIAKRGQSAAEEAFEQSSGGETLEEAQARQLRGEHAFSPQPETRGAVDENCNDGGHDDR